MVVPEILPLIAEIIAENLIEAIYKEILDNTTIAPPQNHKNATKVGKDLDIVSQTSPEPKYRHFM